MTAGTANHRRLAITGAIVILLLIVGGSFYNLWLHDERQLRADLIGEWRYIQRVDQTGAISKDPFGPIPYIFHPDGRMEVRHSDIGGLNGTYRIVDRYHIELTQDALPTPRVIGVAITGEHDGDDLSRRIDDALRAVSGSMRHLYMSLFFQATQR